MKDIMQLVVRLDGYRSSYFMDWFLPKWASDPKRLQYMSVAELVTEYDRYQTIRRVNAESEVLNEMLPSSE